MIWLKWKTGFKDTSNVSNRMTSAKTDFNECDDDGEMTNRSTCGMIRYDHLYRVVRCSLDDSA